MGDVLSCLNSNESDGEQGTEFNAVGSGSELTDAERHQLVVLKETFGTNFVKNLSEFREANGKVDAIDTLLGITGVNGGLLRHVNDRIKQQQHPDPSNAAEPGSTNLELGCDVEYLKYLVEELKFDNFIRPDAEPFDNLRNDKEVIRIGSWNLKEFSNEKADNPGVKEVICRTVLENGISLLAVQEMGDRESLQKICDELNDPRLPLVRNWSGPRGQWECVVSEKTGRMFRSSEYNGFMFDTTRGIEHVSDNLLKCSSGKDKEFVRKPYIGVFKTANFDFVLVSVHLKATGMKNEDLGRLKEEIDNIPNIMAAIEEELPDEKDIMILGDFNLTPDAEDFNTLRDRGFLNAVPGDCKTNISIANPDGSHTYDNIWMSEQCQSVYTETMGVVRQGLLHPFIPDSWSWGGILSDHCPIWAEFYVDTDHD